MQERAPASLRRILAATLCCASVCAASSAPLPAEPLPADDAFQPSLHLRDGDRAGLVIRYRIAEGYYLYRDRIRIETVPRGAPVGPPEFPEARSIEDAFLGKSWIYRESVEIALPFTGSVADPARIRVRVTAQGCAEDRLCYAPFTQEIRLRDDTQAGGSAP